MKSSALSAAAMKIALLLACVPCYAAEPRENAGDAAPVIAVRATRDPVDKSYRKMLGGMDLFEQKRSMAPDASLRFRLLPRLHGTNMDGIELSIDADSFAIPVPVAPDHSFALERNQKALDEDASVRPNRTARSMTWRADIRTPGLPPGTRRLGDLRLECLVGMEADLVSDSLPGIGQLVNLLLRASGYCSKPGVRYLFFAERPLFGVTLVHGARREILPVEQLYASASVAPVDLAHCDCQVLLDRTYFLPLGDSSWPDDTRIEFEFMEGAQ
jgi:hypothetical protein